MARRRLSSRRSSARAGSRRGFGLKPVGGASTQPLRDDAARREAERRPRLGPLARWVVGVFFRRVEHVGLERVPADGPVVYVANHPNGLVDPAVLMAAMPRAPRLLAKSTLWAIPPLRPLLRAAAAIPVHRRQDLPSSSSSSSSASSDPSAREDLEARNAAMFARCHEVLAAGGVIGLFPEGRSHDEPALVPLKTGVSRIVLEAEARFHGLGTRIVPVGLVFEDKTRFRSRALVSVGESIDPAPEVALYESEPRETVRRLTARVRDGLEAVTVNYPSHELGRQIERAAEIWSRPENQSPVEEPLARSAPLRRLFADGVERLLDERPAEVAAVAEAVDLYDDHLRLYDLTDAQVAARYPAGKVLQFGLASLARLLVFLPLGVLGTVLHAPGYLLVDAIARRFGTTPDVRSTYKVLPSLVVYPLLWLVAAVGAGWVADRLGETWLWALVALVAAPLSGFAAIKLHQRFDLLRRRARAYFLLRFGGHGLRELRELRAAVRARVAALVEVAAELPAE